MAECQQGIYQLLRVAGGPARLLSHHGELRFAGVSHPRIPHPRRIEAHAGLQREPVEMVPRHGIGHGVDLGDFCQIPHPVCLRHGVQSRWQPRRVLREAVGEHDRAARTHRHTPHRGHRLPHLPQRRDHRGDTQGHEPREIYHRQGEIHGDQPCRERRNGRRRRDRRHGRA